MAEGSPVTVIGEWQADEHRTPKTASGIHLNSLTAVLLELK